MAILIKNARQAASPEDGARVLVEREGLGDATHNELRAWLPALAPSAELSQWFHERPRQWRIFRRRYLSELCSEAALDALGELHVIAAGEPVMTLLTMAAELERSHGAILRDLLSGERKPPSSTGPARAAAGGRVRARKKA